MALSTVPVVLAALGVDLFARHQDSARRTAIAQDRAVAIAHGLEPMLVIGQGAPTAGPGASGQQLDSTLSVVNGELGATTKAALAEAASRWRDSGAVTGLQLWTPRGRLIVDGLDPQRHEQQTEIDAALFDAAAGTIASRPSTGTGDAGTEVFVPLRAGSDVVAVAQITVPQDAAGLAAARSSARRVLLGALAALWLALIAVAAWVAGRLRRSEEQFRHQALVDPLTGLANQRHFEAVADAALAALGTVGSGGAAASVALIDVVGYDRYRELLGPRAADEVLVHTAARLSAMVQPGQAVARIGRHRFALFLPGTDSATVLAQTDVLRSVCEAELLLDGLALGPEIVLGVAAFPADAASTTALVAQAELALDAAKAARISGRAYGPELDGVNPSRIVLAAELGRAIARDELFLVFQPKIGLHDQTIRGVEALVRWDHPERGRIVPDDFIPMAELTGHIVPLTNWVLDRAVSQTAHWACNGLPMRTSINVSVRDLRNERFPELVMRALARHQLPPEYLEVEISERAVLDDPERVARAIRRLREAGVAVALDDFGRGPASLTMLRDLAVSSVKLDASLIAGLCTNGGDAAMVHAAIGVAHQLGIEVVAEAVEKPEQYETLVAWGCDVAQGFALDRPLTAGQLTKRFGRSDLVALEVTALERQPIG